MFELGIYISTIRPKLWESLYENLAINNVNFEIVLVGPLKNVSLPPKCRFIYSDSCPAECYHIGAMSCNSKYIMGISDDCRFESEHSLDFLVEYLRLKSKSCPASIVSPLYKIRRKKPTPAQTFAPFNKKKTWNPIVPVGILVLKQLYIDIGGIDRRFKNMLWDIDIAMRIYEIGGNVYINDSVIIFEEVPGVLSGSKISKQDDKLLRSLWCTGRRQTGWTIHKKRRGPVFSFDMTIGTTQLN